jgi:hypothetical protein
MADPPRYTDTGHDTGVGPDREATGMPRWVRVSGIIVVIVVLVVVIVMLVGGGEHGPRRHATSSAVRSQAPPSDVTAVRPPPEGVLG